MVDATDVKLVEEALTPQTRLVFVETIANPRTQVADLARIGALCRARGILFIVDNTMTSPYLFQPKAVGAGLVVEFADQVHRRSRQTRWEAALTDTGLYDWSALSQYRHRELQEGDPQKQWGLGRRFAPRALRDFWRFAGTGSGASHRRRFRNHGAAPWSANAPTLALAVAQMLEADPRVAAVQLSGPAHRIRNTALATELFRSYGSLLSFELKEGIDCFDYLNRLQLGIASSNLGDTRTLVIPGGAHHFLRDGRRMPPRLVMGIAESLIRVSIGLEDTGDLVEDFRQALDA